MFPRTALRTCVPLLRPVWLSAARSVSSAPLVHIQNGTFYRQYPSENDGASNPPLYPNFNFTLPSHSSIPAEQQHWAVIGTSGRTDLLDIIRGQHIAIPPTARSYPYLLTEEVAAKDPRLRFVGNAVQYIGFSGEGSGAIGGTRGAYLSARYESHREETDWTVEQFLRGQTSLNPVEGEEKGTLHDEELLRGVITDLRLTDLLHMPVANLSNGQTRRARVAKALLKKPELLLLDEPFMGLDPATVRGISGLLHRLGRKGSPRLILALRPQDPVPDWITHLIVVGNNNQIVQQGPKRQVEQTLESWRDAVSHPPKKLGLAMKKQLDSLMESGILDDHLLEDLSGSQSEGGGPPPDVLPGGEPLIEMDGVRVQYGDRVVLGDWNTKVNGESKSGLHWRVRRGQRWAILGGNGSGKTTLLSLITSDHPQTYALPIKLFGRSRLPEVGKPGISIFELQSRLGHSSPEIHAFFPRQLTVREALESAFAETFLSRPKLNVERDLDVDAILHAFKPELDSSDAASEVTYDKRLIPRLNTKYPEYDRLMKSVYDADYADTVRFGQLTTAQQRIVLFLRALVHKPDIVVLDEPFSGLTASQRDKCLQFLESGEAKDKRRRAPSPRHTGLSQDQALILISHVKEEIPDIVRYYMRLPTDSGDGSPPLPFRFGPLNTASILRDPDVWERAWSGGPSFRRTTPRRSQKKFPDIYEFEWHSI